MTRGRRHLALCLILAAAGCDLSGDADGSGGGITTDTFFAFLEGVGPQGEDGTVELTLPAVDEALIKAATGVGGTLSFPGDPTTVKLRGKFDPEATPSLELSGLKGVYRVEGDIEDGELRGSYSGPGGAGSLTSISACERRMLGTWIWSGAVDVDCEVQGFDNVTSDGFVRYTLEDGAFGATFVSLANDGLACPFDPLLGICSGDSYEETHDETNSFSGCTSHQVSTLRITFGETTFEGTYSVTTSTEGSECELADTCTFTHALAGQRTTEFPTCEVATSVAPSPGGKRGPWPGRTVDLGG